jgi:hypothetical protein
VEVEVFMGLDTGGDVAGAAAGVGVVVVLVGVVERGDLDSLASGDLDGGADGEDGGNGEHGGGGAGGAEVVSWRWI